MLAQETRVILLRTCTRPDTFFLHFVDRASCNDSCIEVVLTQFVSPDDTHDVLETCRELKIKINTQKRIVRHVGHFQRL